MSFWVSDKTLRVRNTRVSVFVGTTMRRRVLRTECIRERVPVSFNPIGSSWHGMLRPAIFRRAGRCLMYVQHTIAPPTPKGSHEKPNLPPYPLWCTVVRRIGLGVSLSSSFPSPRDCTRRPTQRGGQRRIGTHVGCKIIIVLKITKK